MYTPEEVRKDQAYTHEKKEHIQNWKCTTFPPLQTLQSHSLITILDIKDKLCCNSGL